jgi:VanZ family protein
MGLIFSFSNQTGTSSSSLSTKVLTRIAITIDKDMTDEEIDEFVDKYSFIIRKVAHLTIYFILGILAYINLKEYMKVTPALVIYSIIFCLVYASTDEIHQLLVNGRSGNIYDVILDTCGSTLAILISYYSRRRLKK